MKVAFVQIEIGQNIALMVLSSVLKENGHIVELFVNPLEKKFIKKLTDYRPDLIGFSCITGLHRYVLRCIKKIKSHLDVIVIVGGPHCTYFPQFIDNEGVDIICIGEGEQSLIDLCNAIEEKIPYHSINNLWVKTKDGIVKNPLYSLRDEANSFPIPDNSIYDKYPFYYKIDERYLYTSRGCPYNCSFCYNHAKRKLYEKQRDLRFRNIDSIIEEAIEIKRKYKPRLFQWIDDNIGVNRQWLFELCTKYAKKVNVPFFASTRADLVDEEIIHYLAKANCYCLSLGVETGDEELRNTILRKNIKNEVYIRAAELIKGNGIRLRTSNMFCLPHEDVEKALKTVRLNQEMGTDYPFGYMFQPYPGTWLYDYSLKNNCLSINYTVDDIDALGIVSSPIKIKEKKKILVIHRLLYYLVRYKGLLRILKLFYYIPSHLLGILHKIAAFINYCRDHKIKGIKAFNILFRYWLVIKTKV